MVVFGRIQRYVFMEALYSLATTLGVILGAILLVDVVEQIRTVGSRANINMWEAFQLTLLKTPGLVLETLPFAVLVGAILAYTRLNRRSELPAMRAAGVSAWRFVGPVVLLAGLSGILAVTVVDPLSTRLSQHYETIRKELVEGRSSRASLSDEGVWLRQGDASGQAVIFARAVEGRAQALRDVTVYFFERPEGGDAQAEIEFTRRLDARRAVLNPGFWQLEGVVENVAGQPVLRHELLALPTTLEPETLISRYASPKTIPFWDLPRFIRDTQKAGLDETPYVLKFNTLLSLPVLLAAMAMIGAVVCLRLARSGGMTRLIATGAFAGFVLFFVTRVSGGLSASGAAPPEAAAWCPPLFALFAVMNVIAFAEDG